VNKVAESVLIATVFLAGAAVGSFLNVVIFRGPAMWGLVDAPPRGDLVAPRSYCPACKAPLAFWNLVPLASYFLQRGRCAACGAPIAARYPIVEVLGGAGAIIALLAYGWTVSALLAAVFAMALIALAFIDLETGYLPDAITLPLIALGLAVNFFGVFVPPAGAVIGAAAAFIAFWAIGAAYQRLRGRDGLGLGDAKLLAAIGAWTGWTLLPFVIFIAAALTLAFAALRGLARSDAALPFGPGLCAAGFIALFFGEPILSVL
jgi:leader peptidase (prepilin peptidase)/N-methyltransferase